MFSSAPKRQVLPLHCSQMRKQRVKEKSVAQCLVVRKVMELGLEARLAQSYQSQLLCSPLPCTSGVTYSGSRVCVICCTEHCDDMCQTNRLGTIAGCWGFNKVLLFSLNFCEHFTMSTIYKSKATTQRKIISLSFEMFYILTCLVT